MVPVDKCILNLPHEKLRGIVIQSLFSFKLYMYWVHWIGYIGILVSAWWLAEHHSPRKTRTSDNNWCLFITLSSGIQKITYHHSQDPKRWIACKSETLFCSGWLLIQLDPQQSCSVACYISALFLNSKEHVTTCWHTNYFPSSLQFPFTCKTKKWLNQIMLDRHHNQNTTVVCNKWNYFITICKFWTDIHKHLILQNSLVGHCRHLSRAEKTPISTLTSSAVHWFNIKMLSNHYRKSHCRDETVVILFYPHNGNSYTVKTAFYIESGPWSSNYRQPHICSNARKTLKPFYIKHNNSMPLCVIIWNMKILLK